MTTTKTTKKLMMAAILTSGLTFAISQAALAQPAKHGDRDSKYKGDTPCFAQVTPEMEKAREKFLAETTVERKALAQKNAEMRAIMKAGTPDPVKASEVAGELFELREKLRVKAKEAGFPLPMLLMGQGYHDGLRMKHHMN
jgi:zinc resistance-associated protein